MTNSLNRKRSVLIFAFLNVFIAGYSQTKIKVSVENQSCIHCDCSFLKNDSTVFNSRTDSEGFLTVAEYVLNDYTGFEIQLGKWQKCYIAGESIDLAKGINCDSCNIKDVAAPIKLNEIVVYAKRNIVEDDGAKLVYNAARDLTNASVTTADVLRKTPMVSVDINGTPSIKGNQNVKILVNNREISGLPPVQIIEQIPSGDVEKIEVITSPGARYDAEGTSGIINVITRKKIYFKSSGFANFGAGTKGSHLFASHAYNFNKQWSILNSFSSLISYSKTKNIQKYGNSETDIFQRESDGKNNGNLYSYQFTLSETSEMDNLNINLNWYSQNLGLNETFKTENQTNKSHTQNRYSFYKVAADYGRKFSDAVRIDLSSSGFYLPIDNKMKLNDFENKYNYSIANNTNYLDMEFLFSKKIHLKLGAKSALNFFKDENSQADARQINIATYLEGYYKITNKVILNLGARYENYRIKGWADVDKNYKDLFLDGNINYKFDNKTTLSFLFGKRTQRPSYSTLLPIEDYTSSNAVSVGNPGLNSEMSYNYEIGFSKYIGNQFIKVSPFYKYINKKISNFISVKDNLFYTNYINIDAENDFGVSLWTSLNLFRKKLNVNYGLDVIYKHLEYDNLMSTGIRFLNNMNITYKITDNCYLNFFGTFNTPNIYLQGKETSYTFSNLSLQKNFYNGNLRIAVSLDNPFEKGITIKQKYIIENYTYDNQLTYYNRGIRLFIIYKFGKKQPEPEMKMQNDILHELPSNS